MINEVGLLEAHEHSYDTYHVVLVPKNTPINEANETRRLTLTLEENVSKHDQCVFNRIVETCDIDRITLKNHWTIHTVWPVSLFPKPLAVTQ